MCSKYLNLKVLGQGPQFKHSQKYKSKISPHRVTKIFAMMQM